MSEADKPLAWLHGEIRTQPFSAEARVEAGVLLRRLQRGDNIALPHSRPMPEIGRVCHEIAGTGRKQDMAHRVARRYRSGRHLEVFAKTTQQTPKSVIQTCKARLKLYASL